MAVRLSVRSNLDGSEGALDFDKDVIVLGQGQGVDLELPDENVSPEHVQLLLHEGQWIVLDVGSATGTLFNGYPLEAQQPVLINPGDVLSLGPYDVQFDLVEDGALAGMAPPVAEPEPQPQTEAYPSTPEAGAGASSLASPQQDVEAYPPTPGLRFEEESDASDKTEVVASAFIDKVMRAFGVEEEAPPYLTVLNGNNAGAVLQLRELNAEMLIGRSRKADFVIEDECISREHARVRRDLNGIHIVDLGSRNGVLLNGVQVQGAQRLSSGDEVRLGTTKLKFTDPTAAMIAPSVKAPKREEDIEGTIVRPTEAMEVEEVEQMIAQSREAVTAVEPEPDAYQAEPEPEPQPDDGQPYAEPEPEPYEPVPEAAVAVEEEALEEPVQEEPVEEEPLEEEPLEEEPLEEELIEEEPAAEEELLEEVEEEAVEEEEEEEYAEEWEDEEEEDHRSLLVPLIVVAVVLFVFTGVVIVFVLS
jgi:pSer/pThr/pTyr-binding forkhead associated (FHA) protein